MSIAKVIEVIAEGDTLQGAIENAAREASKTLKNVRSVYVEGIQGLVENGTVTSFRVNAKVTFVLEG
jgi:dodecin